MHNNGQAALREWDVARIMSYLLGVATVIFLIVATAARAAPSGAYQAGFDEWTLTDPHRGRTLPVALWYPTSAPETPLSYSPVQPGSAARAAAPQTGRWPLVLLSHGTGGNRFNQSMLAETLARAGFIVAALEHPGDRTFDDGDGRTARNLLHRPQDVRFLLDALLAPNSGLAKAIDATRVAMIGHSAGGFTAAVVAGGRPNVAGLEAYCRDLGTTDDYTCLDDRPALPADPIERAYLEGKRSLVDPRIRAVILMAPAIGPFFDGDALAEVSAPVLLFWAGSDAILPEPANSRYYANGLARVHDRPFPAVGHFTFLNTCSPFLATVAAEICSDPSGVDRASVLDTVAQETMLFLREHLQQ